MLDYPCLDIKLTHSWIQSEVHGVIVLARNGDRKEYYQNPNNYAGAFTETTPLGEVSSFTSGIWSVPVNHGHVATGPVPIS